MRGTSMLPRVVTAASTLSGRYCLGCYNCRCKICGSIDAHINVPARKKNQKHHRRHHLHLHNHHPLRNHNHCHHICLRAGQRLHFEYGWVDVQVNLQTCSGPPRPLNPPLRPSPRPQRIFKSPWPPELGRERPQALYS